MPIAYETNKILTENILNVIGRSVATKQTPVTSSTVIARSLVPSEAKRTL